MKKRYSMKSLYIICMLTLFGCAVRAPEEGVLIFPAPPEEPKVVYLESHRGEADFQEKNIFDVLFGAPVLPPLRKPYGIYAEGDRIYIADSHGPSIVVIDTRERRVEYFGSKGTGKLGLPIGIAKSADGLLYVSDAKHKKIFAFDMQGKLKLAIGKKDEFGTPAGMSVSNSLKRLYIVDTTAHAVRVYSLSGDPLLQFGKRGSGKGEFNYPTNIAVNDATGELYVTDTMNFRVQVFDREGKFLRFFGQVGDKPGYFMRPKGIALDSEGHVYVVDAAFNNLQILDKDGLPLLFIGEAGRGHGSFLTPAGIYIDSRDRIYISDQLNNRVEVYQFLSESWKKEHPDEYKKYLLQ